jgi:hypothetical protein
MWPGELEISDLEVASEESVDATGALGGLYSEDYFNTGKAMV